MSEQTFTVRGVSVNVRPGVKAKALLECLEGGQGKAIDDVG